MDRRGDQMKHTAYTLNETIRALGIVAREWKKGARSLDKALKTCDSPRARSEADNAWVCYHVFRSAWNTYRAFRLRRKWAQAKLPAYLKIAADEKENLAAVLPILERDARFGFHIEAHDYMFDAKSVRRKLRGLRKQLRELTA